MADEEHIEVKIDENQKVDGSSDDEIAVEIVEKTEKNAKNEQEPPTKAISADEGIEKLKRKFEMERQRSAEAEKRAAVAENYARRASFQTQDANYQLVVSAMETVKGRSEQLKAAYSSAMAAGDFDKAAEVQEALAVNAHQLSELAAGERDMRAQLERAAREAQAQPVQPMPRGDEPIAEQLARSVSPKSASWLRANKEAISDERAVKRMFRAHEDALDDGIEPDTDEYFRFIEGRLGIQQRQQPEREPADEAAPAPRKASYPPPPAPVSRGGSRPNTVRLTREEAEMAKMMGMKEAEYAKHKVALQSEGKIGNR